MIADPESNDTNDKIPAAGSAEIAAGEIVDIDASWLAMIGQELVNHGKTVFNSGKDKLNNGNDRADHLRIERHTKANGDTYWYWAERKRITGKNGGYKWRSYGGKVDSDGRLLETTGKRGGKRAKKQGDAGRSGRKTEQRAHTD